MNRRFALPVFLVVTAVFLGFPPRPIQAQVSGYKVQTIAKPGDTIGDLKISTNGSFGVGKLNDSGQLAFTTDNAAGGAILFQYRSSDGTFIPIAVGGRDAPGGKWPRSLSIYGFVSMNQQGDIIFGTESSPNNIYRWDHQSGQVSLVVAAGMPATNGLTFTAGADGNPVINDFGEVAFQARLKDSAGTTQRGIFFLGRDGKLVPVALPGQTVAGIGLIQPDSQGGANSVNNAGVVGFRARRAEDKSVSVFLWENGTITPVALVGADAPGGGKFTSLSGAAVNNKNLNAFVAGNSDGVSTHWNLYMWTGDHLVAICTPGQAMPGGGQFMELVSFSSPSSAGESAFKARLDGGDMGIYRVDADGNLALVVKSSELGAKFVDTNIGSSHSYGIGINSKREIVLPVRFTGDRVDSLVLLTPASP
jgi:hypothetical protein